MKYYAKWHNFLLPALLSLAISACKGGNINVVEEEQLFAYSAEGLLSADESFAVFSGPVRAEFIPTGKKSDGALILSRKGEKDSRSGSFSRYYSIYPYSTELSCYQEGAIRINLPSTRQYVEGGIENRLLIAATTGLSTQNLQFKDLCSIVNVHVIGNECVKNITLKGGAGEILGGPATICFNDGSFSGLETSSVGADHQSVDCGAGIQLAEKEEGFDFLIPIPSGTYTSGFDIEIETADSLHYDYEFHDSLTLTRGSVHKLTIDDMFHSQGHSLLSFGVNLNDGKYCDAVDVSGSIITLCVPRGTDVRGLKPIFKHNGYQVLIGENVQKSGKSEVDFTNPVTYTVLSGEGEKSFYTISVLDIDIPAIIICTPEHQKVADRENWILQSKFVVLDNKDWSYTDYGPTGIKGRGNSSWSYAKKPYAIKFENRPQKMDPPIQTLLGMPGHKRWCLLSNCMGYHMTNQLGYEVGRRSTFEWSPHARYVELILNGEHKGLYSLVEQVRIDKYRIPIKEMDAEDITEKKITGGYLMNFDNTMDEPPFQFYTSYYKMPVMIKSPDSDVMVQAQFDYIQNYINTMEASLKSDSLFVLRDYLNYLDVDSFIGAWMTKELAGRKSKATGTSTDFIQPRSVYYYKDREGLLKAGPAWDFDVHFLLHTEVLNCTKCQYYGRLFQDSEFTRRVKELWPDFKSNLQGNSKFPTSITAYVDSLYNVCAYSAARDEKMWKSIWKSYPWYDAATQRDRHKQALTDRITYMESEILKME